MDSLLFYIFFIFVKLSPPVMKALSEMIGRNCGRDSTVASQIPRTCENVTLHGEKDFADVIKVKDSEREQAGLSRWAQSNHMGLKSGKPFHMVSFRDRDVTREGQRHVTWLVLKMECGKLLKPGKDKETDPLPPIPEPPERN